VYWEKHEDGRDERDYKFEFGNFFEPANPETQEPTVANNQK
jgi:hypothetical protein